MHWLALSPLHEPASAGDPETRADAADNTQLLIDAGCALGWWALRFTPRVCVLEQVVLLEVSTSERLFGGRRQLVERLLAAERPVVRIRMAQAGTALQALARLQLGDASTSRQPDQLPLHTLAEARPHLATLERLGCQVWGDLRALPRGGVVRRFGASLLDALDRAYGLRPEVYPWLVLPEVFDMPLELQAQVEAAPALLFAARRLLAQLQAWLQARQRGVLALELLWQMDARRDTATEGSLVVRTAVPTLDMAHMQRLLAEHLERTTLPAPVLTLRLRTRETAALAGASASLLPDAQHDGDDWLQLLERLAARLGPEQVVQVLPCADHRPERMQHWVAAAGDAVPSRTRAGGSKNNNSNNRRGEKKRRPASPGPRAASDALYPTWLLASPLRLAVRNDRPLYQGPLTLLAGPQRLEAAWWDVRAAAAAAPQPAAVAQPTGASETRPAVVAVAAPARQPGPEPAPSPQASHLALRDYFLARSEQAGLLWIYRERLPTARQGEDKPAGHWYLHGVFG